MKELKTPYPTTLFDIQEDLLPYSPEVELTFEGTLRRAIKGRLIGEVKKKKRPETPTKEK